MAGKINKKSSVDIKGVLNLDDGFISLLVDDIEEPVFLAKLINEYENKEIKITVNYGEEL